eukprot:2573314-Amphidinium_carterae.1
MSEGQLRLFLKDEDPMVLIEADDDVEAKPRLCLRQSWLCHLRRRIPFRRRQCLPVQVLTQMTSCSRPMTEDEVVSVFTRLEELPLNELRSGVMHGRPCLWIATSHEIPRGVQRSLQAWQETGMVLCRMTGDQAYNSITEFQEVAKLTEMDLKQFPVYVLSSHDLVFRLLQSLRMSAPYPRK